MYGYTEAEALRMNILDTIPQEKKEEINLFLSNLKNNESTLNSFVLKRLRKDGTIISVWITATLLKDDNDQLKGIATTERDLSQLTSNAHLNLTGEDYGPKR